ncbi:MAG: 6,7-dimethyl-8-ribityllumazine synthase [Verrucomicrobiota bacterium]|nr:6,7-dimethyl-8-ribityllumazine synthase [Verrucomicrobiota bacterium]
MLKNTTRKRNLSKKKSCITIVASTYNAEYVDGMIAGALEALANSGIENVELIRVPGAFEIPVAVARLTRRKLKRPEAVLCLGVILRGKTKHADHIGDSVTQSLAQIAITSGIPVIHEVLLLETKAQAKARCLSIKTNRGTEGAHTALEMAALVCDL